MTAFPTPLDPATRGTWGPQLVAAIEDKIAAELLAHTPGIELGYAERLASFATTNTAAGDLSAGSKVTGLVVTVEGQGRPVDIEFYAPNVYHSVAGTGVTAYTICNGVTLSAETQVAGLHSHLTTSGGSLILKRRVVLLDGVSYTFEVGISGAVAGTTTLVAAGFAAIQLSVTSR